jgi:hypothetical protein
MRVLALLFLLVAFSAAVPNCFFEKHSLGRMWYHCNGTFSKFGKKACQIDLTFKNGEVKDHEIGFVGSAFCCSKITATRSKEVTIFFNASNALCDPEKVDCKPYVGISGENAAPGGHRNWCS